MGKITTRDGAFSPHNDNNGITVKSNYFFQFWTKSLSGDIKLAVALYDGKKWLTNVNTEAKYVNHWAITNSQWTRVRIPVKDLGVDKDLKIDRLKIQVADSWTLKEDKSWLISDVRFAAPGNDPLTPAVSGNGSPYKSNQCFVDPIGIVNAKAAEEEAKKKAEEEAKKKAEEEAKKKAEA